MNYSVIAFERDVYTTDNLDYAIHEMIALIYNRLKYIVGTRNLTIETNIIADIYLDEYKICPNKYYRYSINKHSYDLLTRQIIKTPIDTLYNLNKLLETYKWNEPSLPSSNTYPLKELINPHLLTLPPIPPNVNTLGKFKKIDTAVPDQSVPDQSVPDHAVPDTVEDKLAQLEKEIAEIEKLKSEQLNKLTIDKETQETKLKELTEYATNVNYIKKKEYLKKEQDSERITVFAADKRAYKLICDDIIGCRLTADKISPLFIHKYRVLSYLDKSSLSDNPNLINIYYDLINKNPESEFHKSYSEYLAANFANINLNPILAQNIDNLDFDLPDIFGESDPHTVDIMSQSTILG
jgi:hypothetical protein